MKISHDIPDTDFAAIGINPSVLRDLESKARADIIEVTMRSASLAGMAGGGASAVAAVMIACLPELTVGVAAIFETIFRLDRADAFYAASEITIFQLRAKRGEDLKMSTALLVDNLRARGLEKVVESIRLYGKD